MAVRAPSEIARNVDSVRDRMAKVAIRAGAKVESIELVAVTKTVAPGLIEAVLETGVRVLAENRVQETASKIPLVSASKETDWHMVGHLQTNKARAAVDIFGTIQSVDSEKLAHRLDLLAGERGRRLPVLLEVNTSGEPSKSGWRPETLVGSEGMWQLPNLEIRGLMTIGPLAGGSEEIRRAFRSLRRLYQRLGETRPIQRWDTLSMGMTDDFEIAIEEGSTMIRVGRAIFGSRP